MNGFGGDAESLAAASEVDKMTDGVHSWADLRLQERENNLRTREEMLLQRESDLQIREEALAREENQIKQRWEEDFAKWEDHARKRDEYVSEFNAMLQQMRENVVKSREDAVKSQEDARADRKQLEERLSNIERLQLRMQAKEEALRIREQEAERKRKHRLTVEALYSRLLRWFKILSPGSWLVRVVTEIQMLANTLRHRYCTI